MCSLFDGGRERGDGFRPHFIVLSLYKLFGYPTGLGVLIVRNSELHTLFSSSLSTSGASNNSYFGGGCVDAVCHDSMMHVLKPRLCDRLERGTPNFQSILQVPYILEYMR